MIGFAGVLAFVGFAAYLVVSSAAGSLDPLSMSRIAVAHDLTRRSGSGLAELVVAVSAISYVPLVVFLGGLRRVIPGLDRSSIAGPILSTSSALFLAGAIASDGFTMAVPLTQHVAAWAQPSPDLAATFAGGWLVCLTEAQVALGVVCVVAGITILKAGRGGAQIPMPGWLGWWGLLGGAAVVPLLFGFADSPVFIVSNLVRLSWILVCGLVLLRAPRQARVAS